MGTENKQQQQQQNELLRVWCRELAESVKPLYMSSIKKHSRIEYRLIERAD